MAEILLGLTQLNGSTTVAGNMRIIKPLQASISGSTTTTAKTPFIRKYVKANVNAKTASMTGSMRRFKTISADLVCESTLDAYWTERNIRQDMGDYMPTYYKDIREAVAIIQTEANEITRMRAQLNKVFDNFFIVSSEPMLDRWETLLNLTPGNRDLNARRQRIMAKLQGAGTSTIGAIKALVDSFYTCKVSEKNRENTIDILITGYRGIPKNFPDIVEAVNEIIPAHLAVRFAFSYVQWSDVEASFMEFYDVDNVEWETLEVSYPQPPTTRLTWTQLETMQQAQTDIIQFSVDDTRLKFD